jgi:hypothetical protein
MILNWPSQGIVAQGFANIFEKICVVSAFVEARGGKLLAGTERRRVVAKDS